MQRSPFANAIGKTFKGLKSFLEFLEDLNKSNSRHKGVMSKKWGG